MVHTVPFETTEAVEKKAENIRLTLELPGMAELFNDPPGIQQIPAQRRVISSLGSLAPQRSDSLKRDLIAYLHEQCPVWIIQMHGAKALRW